MNPASLSLIGVGSEVNILSGPGGHAIATGVITNIILGGYEINEYTVTYKVKKLDDNKDAEDYPADIIVPLPHVLYSELTVTETFNPNL